MTVRRTGSVRPAALAAGAGLGLALVLLAVFRPWDRAGRPAYDWTPGARLVYHIDFETSSTADLRALFEDPLPQGAGAPAAPSPEASFTRTSLRGKLYILITEAGANEVVCAVRFAEPSVSVELGTSRVPDLERSAAAALTRQFFVKMTPTGRVLGVLLDPGTDDLTRGLVHALLSKMQTVLPGRGGRVARSWEAGEDGPNGAYVAVYRVRGRPAKGLGRFVKVKLPYQVPGSGRTSLFESLTVTARPSGELAIAFDLKSGRLQEARGHETESLAVADKEVARIESRIDVRLIAAEEGSSSELAALRLALDQARPARPFVPLTISISGEESERTIQRSALGEATLGSLLADLRAAVGEGRTRDTALYLKFKALVFLQPEVCPSLAEALEGSGPDSLTADVVGGALGVVGHPEAQAALASAILARRDDPVFVSRTVPFLTMARRPTDAAERALIDLAESRAGADVRSAALFGLGTMARNSRDADPGRADRIAARLLARLREPIPEAEADIVLKALGNSGSVKALPTFAEYARGRSAGLRAAAVTGLRFVDASEADHLLIEALRSDPEASVRIAALQAFSFRRPTGGTVKAHIGALTGDPSESVRVAALRNLGKMIGEFPEALEAVSRAADDDASESVRKAAAAILAGRKK
jgi:hypothetical protein